MNLEKQNQCEHPITYKDKINNILNKMLFTLNTNFISKLYKLITLPPK